MWDLNVVYSSVFTERYAGASDTALKQDFDQVKDWLTYSSKKPVAVKEAEITKNEIDWVNSTKGAVCKAVFNLIALKGALDFYNEQSIELIKLNDHHIFPSNAVYLLMRTLYLIEP